MSGRAVQFGDVASPDGKSRTTAEAVKPKKRPEDDNVLRSSNRCR